METNQAPLISPEKITELDVRPILKSGGEPFSEIMGAIQRVPADGALRLRATFKPTPLFQVLGKQGWSNYIEHGEGDDWSVLFYKSTDGGQGGMSQSSTQPKASRDEMRLAYLQRDYPELQKRLKVEGNTWTLNVQTMSPPEPMELTLLVLDKLPQDAVLIQINQRVPQFLLPLLEERGFKYSVDKNEGEEFHIRIERAQ